MRRHLGNTDVRDAWLQEFGRGSDVYAFGVVLWELLTWHLPFEALNPWQVRPQAVLTDESTMHLPPRSVERCAACGGRRAAAGVPSVHFMVAASQCKVFRCAAKQSRCLCSMHLLNMLTFVCVKLKCHVCKSWCLNDLYDQFAQIMVAVGRGERPEVPQPEALPGGGYIKTDVREIKFRRSVVLSCADHGCGGARGAAGGAAAGGAAGRRLRGPAALRQAHAPLLGGSSARPAAHRGGAPPSLGGPLPPLVRRFRESLCTHLHGRAAAHPFCT